MLYINDRLQIPEHEMQISAIRAQGPGGQNVNKVSSAIHLRFDIQHSSLPAAIKQAMQKLNDRRITADGVLIIKAQQSRSQEANRTDALQRLREIILKAMEKPKPRRATRPSRSARRRRMDSKTRRGTIKSLRGKVSDD